MTVALLVARRAGNPRRDQLWDWCKGWWSELGPIYEGHHDDGPFNLSAARNRAARAAGDWDIAVHLDADVVLADPDQLHRAVDATRRTGRLTVAHDCWRGLNSRGTNKVLAGWAGNWGTHVETHKPMTASSCIVVPRPLWEELGGFDERFIGWGFEDTAFMLAAKTAGAGTERIHGDVFHLNHPISPEKNPDSALYRANRRLRKRYSAAQGDWDAMRAILSEDGAPLSSVLV